jgi:hypothetical protein
MELFFCLISIHVLITVVEWDLFISDHSLGKMKGTGAMIHFLETYIDI